MESIGWEYKTVLIDLGGFFRPNVKLDTLDAALNQEGEDGWELVTAVPVATGNGATIAFVCFFKRRYSE